MFYDERGTEIQGRLGCALWALWSNSISSDLHDLNDESANMTDEVEDYAEKYDSEFRLRQPPRSLLSKGSKPIRVTEQDQVTGEWRTFIRMSRVKFDDEAKARFLDEYRKWGRMGESAAAAGVSKQTVRKAMMEDEEFGEAMMAAEEEYKDKLIGHHQDLVFNGQERVSYDRNGNVVSRETIYPIRLIELELKKHDPGYREKREVEVTQKGGVLVAPAEMKTIDDWESRFSKAKDVTPTEDTTVSPDTIEDDDVF